MEKRGGMIYAPKIVIDEMNSIRKEEQIDSAAEALKKMVKYTRVGRETRRITLFKFGGVPQQAPVESYFPQIVPRRKRR